MDMVSVVRASDHRSWGGHGQPRRPVGLLVASLAAVAPLVLYSATNDWWGADAAVLLTRG